MESSELLQTTIRRIVIFGSGRWAKVYIKTVVEMVHDEVEIVCCSSYGHQSLLSWAREHGLNERISVQKQISNALSGESTVAIVCNAAKSHYLTVRNIISSNVPVLVEKPFCMYASQLSELMDISQKNGSNLFCAEVFKKSVPLNEFQKLVARQSQISEVSIAWHDKSNIFRHGDISKYDSSVPIYKDCLPHIFAIFFKLFGEHPASFEKFNVRPDLQAIALSGRFNQINYKVEIIRNASSRRREVQIRSARAVFSLDFAEEPGSITNLTTNTKRRLLQANSPTPITKFISSFLEDAFLDKHDNSDELVTVHAYVNFFELLGPFYDKFLLDRLINFTVVDQDPDTFDYLLAEALQRENRLSESELAVQISDYKTLIKENKNAYDGKIQLLFKHSVH